MEKSKELKEQSLVAINSMPNLHEKETSPIEFSNVYWTPEKEGEFKLGVVVDIRMETFPDAQNPEKDKDLLCIVMLCQNEDLTITSMSNGSKKLVATIQDAMEKGSIIIEKTPLRITYLGKKKNKTNAYNSDNWSVKPILL
tara:strand:+ start:7854 stop:8276 length:423 start_codon:yes stop_codon:yes gene_type:complete